MILFIKLIALLAQKLLYYQTTVKIPKNSTANFLDANNKDIKLLSCLILIRTFQNWLKVGLSPSKKNCVIASLKPLKIMKNAFYFILKALFVLKIFKFSSWLFGHVGKTA